MVGFSIIDQMLEVSLEGVDWCKWSKDLILFQHRGTFNKLEADQKQEEVVVFGVKGFFKNG